MSKNYGKKSYEVLPSDTYNVLFDRAAVVTSKSGNKMLKTSFKVVDGEHKNRLIFHNFLLEHPKPIVTEISIRQLDDLLNAIGVQGGYEELGFDAEEVSQVTGRNLKVATGVNPAKGQYSAQTKIKKFLKS